MPEQKHSADDLTLKEVAQRLGKSPRWLQQRLADDARRPPSEQRLQVHHYVGASKRWSEGSYQVLRATLIETDTGKRKKTAPVMSWAPPASSAEVQRALEEVLAWPLRPRIRGAKAPTGE